MSKKTRRFSLFPAYSDRIIFLAVLALAIFGSFMIASAEMGGAAGDYNVIIAAVIRQTIFVILGLIAMAFLSRHSIFALNEHILVKIGFLGCIGALLICRIFPSSGGAYAWIRLGSFSIQPSEFCKVYIIILFAKLLNKDYGEVKNKQNYLFLLTATLIMAGIIIIIQKDLGSGAVLFAIGYILLLIPNRREFRIYQRRLFVFMVIGIAAIVFLLTPMGTDLLSHFDGYQVGRFLSSADPFKYQYDSGYHLIMSLVSFASGGLFGLGYGRSIHKYMNFPNPSNDFILPVIVEELGLVFGFLPIIILYGAILISLFRYAFKTDNIRGRIVFSGVFLYFALHFILNVGGVSGLIPLTGVPLLLLSSGGSSTLACMIAVGIAESEIIRYKKDKLACASYPENTAEPI